MRIAVPRETAPDERRVGLVPDGVAKLVKAGHTVTVERGAGVAAGAPDAAYEKAGALLADSFAATVSAADVVAKVQRPSTDEIALLPEGSVLIAILNPATQRTTLEALASRRITALAMELVPRITRAQSMDVLSLPGHGGRLQGGAARRAPRSPSCSPCSPPRRARSRRAKVFVARRGRRRAAGDRHRPPARRVVSAFDVRPAVREQVQSLGATFVEAEAVAPRGGRRRLRQGARRRSSSRRCSRRSASMLPTMDLVVTTAQIPGSPRRG